jgi:hypothetical protein
MNIHTQVLAVLFNIAYFVLYKGKQKYVFLMHPLSIISDS